MRWMRDSLRLRITPSEFEALLRGAACVEAASFPGGWEATLAPGARTALSSPSPGRCVLTLSDDDLARLGAPDAEGVYFAQDGYRYFVEKDFPCAHPRPAEAPESGETFAAPPGFAERHRTP